MLVYGCLLCSIRDIKTSIFVIKRSGQGNTGQLKEDNLAQTLRTQLS